MEQNVGIVMAQNDMGSGNVLRLGELRLRLLSQPVVDPTDPAVKALVERLVTTAAARDGVGIAAPQLGVNRQLFIVASRPNARYPDAPNMTPMAMVNPTITAVSDPVELGWEGCLSVPGWRGKVPRATAIEVAYLDTQGRHQRREFTGFVARIIQHEYDHLQGTLFLDRVGHTAHLLTEADYQAESRN